MYTSIFTSVCTCVYIYAYIHAYIQTYIYMRIYKRIYKRIYMRIYKRICKHVWLSTAKGLPFLAATQLETCKCRIAWVPLCITCPLSPYCVTVYNNLMMYLLMLSFPAMSCHRMHNVRSHNCMPLLQRSVGGKGEERASSSCLARPPRVESSTTCSPTAVWFW